MAKPKPIGQHVVSLGLATDEEIQQALEEQRRRADASDNIPLGALLVEMGRLAPAQLVRVLDDCGLEGFHLSEDVVRLAARLHRALGEDDRLVMITGASSGEDTPSLTSQLALSLALMGPSGVIAIDANLRSPTFHDALRVARAPGLSEVIDGDATLDEAIKPTGLETLHVLPSGEATGDLLARMMSARCADALAGCRQRAGVTLINAPSILDAPESALLGARADAIVLNVRADHQRLSNVEESVRTIEGLGTQLVGVVLTRTGGRRRRRRAS